MAIVVSVFLYILLFILAVLLAVIFIPIRYSLNGSYEGHPVFWGHITLLQFLTLSVSYDDNVRNAKVDFFGLSFTFDINADEKKSTVKKTADKKVKEKTRKKKSKGSNLSFNFFRNLFNKNTIFHVLYFLRDLIKIIKPRVFTITGRVGFYEPHHTAWMCAILSQLKELGARATINIEPVWEDEHFEGRITMIGRLSIVGIFIRLLYFLFSKNTWRVLMLLRNEKKKKKILKPAT